MTGPTKTLYNRIGINYDYTRRADPHITSRLIDHLSVARNQRILDLACGTGNYAVALSDQGYEVVGIDASERMIAAAKSKSQDVDWHVCHANTLPFDNGIFSGAICTLATHHFDGLQRPFAEVYRVLQNGRFVIFTSTPEQMRGYWLNEYFPEAMKKSMRQMPSLEMTQSELLSAGFIGIITELYTIRPDLQDKFLYSGKHLPELYLDPKNRAGISTFASLADPKEVEHGCERLAKDIESGRIRDVINSFDNRHGDYLFVVARKDPSQP